MTALFIGQGTNVGLLPTNKYVYTNYNQGVPEDSLYYILAGNPVFFSYQVLGLKIG